MSVRIEDLEPLTRSLCEKFVQLCALAAAPVRVTYTLRTFDEQDHLYAKGRTLPGEPCTHNGHTRAVGSCTEHPLGSTVTKAKAGQSAHNFGMAFDVCFDGKTFEECFPSASTMAGELKWQKIGEIGENLGLVWGGPRGPHDDFTFDRPHFERKDWKAASRGG